MAVHLALERFPELIVADARAWARVLGLTRWCERAQEPGASDVGAPP